MNKERETFRGVQRIGIVLALSMALALVTLWALRPETSHGATGVNDPTAGQVFQVAVDTDTTGNPTGSGGLLSALQASASVPVGTTHLIDVIVDEVDTSDQMGAFGFNLKTDPAIVKIVSRSFSSYMLPGAFEVIPAPIPDQTGNWRLGAGQVGFTGPSGEGVLVRIGIECVANGISVLDLADDIGGDGIPNIFDPVGDPITVLNATDGQIVCGTGGTATPTTGSLVWGDNNCSGAADPVDSLLTLRHDAGLSANTGTCPDMGETVDVAGASLHPWGDVDCSGDINPIDSLKLLRADAGLSVSQAANCPEIGSTVQIG